MKANELWAVGIVAFIFLLNWLIASRIDFWVSPFKTVFRDVPLDNLSENVTYSATGLPGTGRPLRKRYRREREEITRTSAEQHREVAKRGLLTVGGLYVLNLGTLWVLMHFGPVSGGVKGIVKPFGGSLSIAAAGVLGGFVVLFLVSVIGFHYLTKK